MQFFRRTAQGLAEGRVRGTPSGSGGCPGDGIHLNHVAPLSQQALRRSGNQALATAHAPTAAGQYEDSSAFADATSWGYRAVARLDYNNAIGAVALSPRVAWAHDVDGNSPGPGGNFLEHRKAVTVGVEANYQNAWTADLSYTDFFGAGRYNLINDRDFVSFNVKYSF